MNKFCGIKNPEKLLAAIDQSKKEEEIEKKEKENKKAQDELTLIRSRLNLLEKNINSHEKKLKFLDKKAVIKHLSELEERIRTLSSHVQLSFLKLMVCTEVTYCADKIWEKIVWALANCDDEWWNSRSGASINGWITHLKELKKLPPEKS